MIPPQELNKRTFSKGLRGYEPTEVDEYISFLIEKYTELFAQCDEYQNKLRLVANRISEIDAKEEAIHKLVISTQKYCDTLKEEAEQKASEILLEAQEKAQNMIAEAEFKEERILINAKEIAENTLLAVSEKAEEQIEDSRDKAEALLMSARTRCAKILNDFRKEIVIQRDGLINLKAMTDNFHNTIFGIYKEHLNSLTENMPDAELDLDYLTESRLLSSIMQDIKKDAINIAERNGNKEYDFEEELAALKIDANDIEANVSKDIESAPRASVNTQAANDSNESEKTTIFTKVPETSSNRASKADSEEDMKVFAGKAAVAATMAGDTMIFDKNTVYNSPAHEDSEQYDQIAQDENDEEEPIATYDSDDFNQDDYNSRNSGSETRGNAGYSSLSSDGVYDGSEDSNNSDDDDDGDNDSGDSKRVGFLGGLFGKKKNPKKKNSSKNRDDDDDIDYELDDDDDDYDIDIDDL